MNFPQNRIKFWALVLLLVNAALFLGVLLAYKSGHHHPALGYLKAFSEAACVGALADWFAVVALFRHPLGIPLPHTAILPAKQSQLAQGVAKFIGTQFLEPVTVQAQLLRLNIGARLTQYAQDKLTPELIGKYLPHILNTLAARLPEVLPERYVGLAKNTLLDYATPERLGGAAARLVALMVEQGLDKKAVRSLAASLHEFVTADDARERILPWFDELVQSAERADLSWWRKLKGQLTAQTFEWADDWIVAKVLDSLADVSLKVQADDNHPVYDWLGAHVAQWQVRLAHDVAWQNWLKDHAHHFVAGAQVEGWLQTLWGKARLWLMNGAANYPSALDSMAALIQRGVLGFLNAPERRDGLNELIASVVAGALTRHQADIREWLTAQMAAWSKERLNHALESAIGQDLQYIRINGTLIGGLAGVLLYGVSQLI